MCQLEGGRGEEEPTHTPGRKTCVENIDHDINHTFYYVLFISCLMLALVVTYHLSSVLRLL